MINLGSISEQSLAGVVATATHGSGISYGAISTNVIALSLLLADGSRVTCSRSEHSDLFMASICGLGTTGIILSVQLEVEPAFRLKEVQRSLPFEDVVQNMDKLVRSAEHVRFWWFPTKDTIRCSYSNRTTEVSLSPTFMSWMTVCLMVELFRQRIQQEAGYGIPSSDTTSSNSSSSSDAISHLSIHGPQTWPVGCLAVIR